MTDPAGERPRRRSSGADGKAAAGRRPRVDTGADDPVPPRRGGTRRGAAGTTDDRADDRADPGPADSGRADSGRPARAAGRAGTDRGTGDSGSTRARTGRDTGRPARSQRPDGEADSPSRRPRRTAGRTEGEQDEAPRRRPDRDAAADAPVRTAGGRWPMAERSVLPTVQGLRPVVAVAVAAVFTAIGVLVDLTRSGGLGTVFTICHISGCVLAVVWVRRAGLFGPVVQPPLLVALSVPVVVLLAGAPRPGQGVAERLLVIGAPLVNAFPVMAWTTGIVLVVALLRVIVQRPLDPPVSAPIEPDAARVATRRSASPRRS